MKTSLIRKEEFVQVLDGWHELIVIRTKQGFRAKTALFLNWMWEKIIKFFPLGFGILFFLATLFSLPAYIGYSIVTARFSMAGKVALFIVSPLWIIITGIPGLLIYAWIHINVLKFSYEIIQFFFTLPTREKIGVLPAKNFRDFLRKFSKRKTITSWFISSKLLEMAWRFYNINPTKFKEAAEKAENEEEFSILFALAARRGGER